LRVNRTKAKLRAGEVVIGGLLGFNAPAVVELLGALGFDFVMFDCEHGPMDIESVEGLVRAAEAYDITPLARVPENSPPTILRFLDRGVQGVMVPHICSGEEARAAVRAAKYYPEGERSIFPAGRTANYGIGSNLQEYVQAANRETMVIAMVEAIEAVERLSDILSVPGVDVIHIGPGDLSQSMGFPEPRVVDETIDRIIHETRQAGKAAGLGGISARNTERIVEYARKGVRFFTISPAALLRYGAEEFLGRVRQGLEKGA
jgi:4-hydroxy-2-oxoheptanedioate aldolase